jgi:hypothetical protein
MRATRYKSAPDIGVAFIARKRIAIRGRAMWKIRVTLLSRAYEI